MNDRQGFGLRIKSARENYKLTLEQAAESCDVSESTWKQYERGDRLPSLPKFINICTILRVKPEYLLGPELEEIQKDLDEIEQLKFEIDQLNADELTVIHATVSAQLKVRNEK